MKEIYEKLSFLGTALIDDLLKSSSVQEIPGGTEILRESQYIKTLPIVLSGLVKVYSRFEERELLLYYIQPLQSCVMSFYSCIKNRPSRIFAVTEEDSRILLLPVDKVPGWLKNYPNLGTLFYDQFDLRYAELLDTIQHLLVNRMDERLYKYLVQKSAVMNQDTLKISHNQIANELGTVREVISRVIKKLETEGKVVQSGSGIKVVG